MSGNAVQAEYYEQSDWSFVLALIALIGVIALTAFAIPMSIGNTKAAGGDDKHTAASQLAIWISATNNQLGGLSPATGLLGADPYGFAYVNDKGESHVQLVDLASTQDVKGQLNPATSLGQFDSSGDVVNSIGAPSVLTLQAGKVTNPKIASSAVSNSNLINGAVTDQKAALANKPLVRLVADTKQDPTVLYTGKIDGVTVANGDLILLTAQTGSEAQNGPWVLSTTTNWSRPEWYKAANNSLNQTSQAFYGVTTVATDGDVYHGSRWYLSTTGTITIDTTKTTWTQIETSPISAPLVVTGEAVNALQVVPSSGGPSNFVVDNLTAGSDTGIKIESNVKTAGVALTAVSTGADESLHISSKGSGDLLLQDATGATGSVVTKQALEVEVKSAQAFTVNNAGSSSNVFEVDTNAAVGAMTGLKVTGVAPTTAGGTRLSTISTGLNDSLSIDSLGTGQLILQNGGVPSATAANVIVLGKNVEFENTADHSLTYGALAIGTARTLSIQGNTTSGGGTAGGSVQIIGGKSTGAAATGGTVTIKGGDSSTSGPGGPVALIGGAPTSGAGGAISITTTAGVVSGTGGAFSVVTGAGTGANGGAISMTTGSSNNAGGGDITFNGGVGVGAVGGSIALNAGAGSGGGSSGGSVSIKSGAGGASGTDAGDITLIGGDAQNGAGANGGSITLSAGKGTAAATGGGIFITTGDSGVGGKGGALELDVGTGAAGNGAIVIGNGANAPSSITIGQSGTTATVNRLAYNSQTLTLTSVSNTLTAADSGKVVLIDAAIAFDVSLPSVVSADAGLRYEFINIGGGAKVQVKSAAGKMNGVAIEPAATTGKTAGTTATFVAAASVAGDRIDIIYLGDFWSTLAYSAAAGGVTIT